MTSANISNTDFMLNKYFIKIPRCYSNKGSYSPFCKLVYCDKLKSIAYEKDLKKAVEKMNLFSFI